MTPDHDFLTLDPTSDEFRELGYRVVDTIADHYDRVEDVPTLTDATPEAVASEFDEPVPMEGTDPDRILDDWDERVYPYAAHQGSPRWFGYVNGSGTPMGVLADALAASVNMNVGGWVLSPSATEVERQCIEWLAEMIGFPTDGGGVLTSGGTMANQAALYAALQAATDFSLRQTGFAGRDADERFTIYESEHEGHSSITRVAEVIGIGREAIRTVPVDDEYRMDVEALEEIVEADVDAGSTPFAVVAQVGSINVSAIDPLAAIADVCAAHDLWMHADGACGAVGAILPEKAPLYAGLERADSVTIDPHKWLSIPYSCGCVLFRDEFVQARAFSMEASYLDVSERAEYQGTNYAFLGPEMSRPFRALKLWMNLKHRGVEGYRTLLAQGCTCAEHLHERVLEAADLEALQEPNLFIYSFRYVPAELQARTSASSRVGDRARTGDRSQAGDKSRAEDRDESTDVDAYADWLNQQIADDLRFSGLAYVTTTTVAGHVVLRFSICSHRTTPEDIDVTVDAILEHGERIDGEERERFIVE